MLSRMVVRLLHIEVVGAGCEAAYGSDYKGENGDNAK